MDLCNFKLMSRCHCGQILLKHVDYADGWLLGMTKSIHLEGDVIPVSAVGDLKEWSNNYIMRLANITLLRKSAIQASSHPLAGPRPQQKCKSYDQVCAIIDKLQAAWWLRPLSMKPVRTLAVLDADMPVDEADAEHNKERMKQIVSKSLSDMSVSVTEAYVYLAPDASGKPAENRLESANFFLALSTFL